MSTPALHALPFTGERFAPEVNGAIWYEHWHRYCVVHPLAEGLSVLDAACGEGYGSYLLAQTAKSVVGLDLAAEAIDHARSRYVAPNLRYLEGSCTALPLANASIDLVVSFETIEHLQQQAEMLAEFRRVLGPHGALVISSPNQPVYSEELQNRNEYHVRELTRDELAALLTPVFPKQRWYGQRVVAHSALWTQDFGPDMPYHGSLLGLVDDEVRVQAEPAPPMYFVVVCAAKNVRLPSLPSLSLFDDGRQSLYNDYNRALLREKHLHWEELDARRIAEDRLAELITVTNDLASERQKAAALANRIVPLEDAFDAAKAELDAEREYTAALTWEERNARAIGEARLTELITAVNNLAGERAKSEAVAGRVISLETACKAAQADLADERQKRGALEWKERDVRKVAQERLTELIAVVNGLASEREKTAALTGRVASLEGTQAELGEARNRLSAVRAELETSKADLDAARQEFARTTTELTTVREQLTGAITELTTVRGQFGRTLSELAVMRAEIEGTKADLAAAEADLTAAEADLTAAEVELVRQDAELAEVRSRLRFRETLVGWLRWPLSRLKSNLRATG